MDRFAKILLALVLAAAPFAAAAEEPNWLHDYTAARKEAKEKQRPLLFDFGTANCVWCRRLEATTFRDAAVQKLLAEQFVVCKVDAEHEAALTQSYGVGVYPTLVCVDPQGKILFRQQGYVEAAAFRQMLERTLRDSGPSEAKPARPKLTARRIIASLEPDQEQRAEQLLTDEGRQACCPEQCMLARLRKRP